MYRILIVEDDLKICEELKKSIERWGFEPISTIDFENVIGTVAATNPHLVLLDINLPFFDGFYWCEKIREFSNVPIIFISSRTTNMDMIMAINMGGDDFVTKPFQLDLLIAKIKGLLRRTYSYQDVDNGIVEHRGAILNVKNSSVRYLEETTELTKNEFKILHILMSSTGKIISKEMLMEELWESDSFIDDNTLAVNINRLRKKLTSIGIENFIETKKHKGYIIS
jgi:DNA-binding response OmpR family regulator